MPLPMLFLVLQEHSQEFGTGIAVGGYRSQMGKR